MAVLLWKLTLVFTEFGYFLAIPLVLTLFIRLRQFQWGLKENLLNLILSGLIVWLIAPVIQAYQGQEKWSQELQAAFDPGTPPPPLFKLSKLLSLNRSQSPSPQSILYSSAKNLHLDLYLPLETPKKPLGWVLVIHGGGWDSGDPTQLAELNYQLVDAGYAVAALAYRLAPAHPWPAPREDALEAVDYLRKNAAEFGLDPDRWVVLGRSAGGQIAEALAYAQKPPGLKGCVAFYAPADLAFAYRYGRDDDALHSLTLLKNYLGGDPEQKKEAYHSASGFEFVKAGSVPTLLFHGPNDPLVWYRQSERLKQKLLESQVPSALITLPWATHGFDYNIRGPGGQISTASILYFLSRVL